MDNWKDSKIFQRITDFPGTSTVTEIISKGIEDNIFIGLLVHGSFVGSVTPNDMDILIVSNGGKRHFEIILRPKVPIEIEYVPINSLFLPLKNFQWYVENWEYEIAKYVHGKIVYDPTGQIKSFRDNAERYPMEIARYLLLHRIGRCSHIIRKLKKYNDPDYGLIASFVNMFALACLAIERKIPKGLGFSNVLNENHRELIERVYLSKEPYDDILCALAMEGFELLGLYKLSERAELDKISFWYPAEVEGLRLAMEETKRLCLLPDMICLENL